jgi:hypothetical protein
MPSWPGNGKQNVAKITFQSQNVVAETLFTALYARALKERFPGAEMVLDAMTPFMVRLHNLKLVSSKISARLHWGLKHGRDLQG